MNTLPEFMLNQSLSISVPLNKIGVEELETWHEETPNVTTFFITLRQYFILDTVFEKINDRCNLLIDAWESEVISVDMVPVAIEVMDYYQSDPIINNVESGFKTVYLAFTQAERLHMPVFLDF